MRELVLQLFKKKSFYAILLAVYVVSTARSINREHHTELLADFYGSSMQDSVSLKDSIVAFAMLQLKKPYAFGAKGPDKFDCSGFTGYVFRNFGIKLSASAKYQSSEGRQISKEELEPGDLIYFRGPGDSSDRVGHIGLITYVTTEKIEFIHSSTHRGVVINDLLQSKHYQSRYLGACRVL